MREAAYWCGATAIVLSWGVATVCTLKLAGWVYAQMPWANPVGHAVTRYGGLLLIVILSIELLGWSENPSLPAWLGDRQEGGDGSEER